MVAGGNRTPAQKLLAFLPNNPFDDPLARFSPGRISWQKKHPDPVSSGWRKVNAFLNAFLFKKGVGNLNQNTRPVTGIVLGSLRPAVVEVNQNGQALAHDFIGFFSFDAGHEPDAAGIMLKSRVVQTLLGWVSLYSHILQPFFLSFDAYWRLLGESKT
jgi:hypothetical protein